MEPRDSFITPLRIAVVQINTNKAEALEDYESNQKERAREVELKKGGRTKWRLHRLRCFTLLRP